MIKLLLFFIIITLSHAATVYISDFEDVLIQAHSTEFINSKINTFKDPINYSGTSELFSGLNKKSKLYFISTPFLGFKEKNKQFISSLGIKNFSLYQQSWPIDWSDLDYKLESIREIISNHDSNTQFVLILTNSADNIELLKRIKQESKIKRIYMKIVFDKIIPKDVVETFVSAFEIAKSELHFNLISSLDVMKVGVSIKNEKDDEKIFPSYTYCPENFYPCVNVKQEEFEICIQVKKKIQSVCGR